MKHARCLKLGLASAVIAWCWTAAAQTPSPPLPTADDWSILELAVRELGAPGVVAGLVFWLTRSFSGWTPTIKIIHERRESREDTQA